MVYGSHMFDKYTHKTHSIVALSSVVFSVALWTQLLLAFTTEGIESKYACVDLSDIKKPKKAFINVFIVWVTLVIVAILFIINMYVLVYVLFSRKLRNDKKL